MRIIADTHCHTTASTHAYASLTEMVHAAALTKLYAVAITDHGDAMPGAPRSWYFKNLMVIPRYLEGVLVLRGAEANIIDFQGNIDLKEDSLRNLDWLVASMHHSLVEGMASVENCTQAWLQIAKNPKVNVIGHSGSQEFIYDYERVIPEFGRNGKLVEINENTFSVRKGSVSNCVTIAKLCKKYGVPIIVNSDAHFHTQLGHYEQAEKLLKEIDFPTELIVNADIKRFQTYLKKYTHVFN